MKFLIDAQLPRRLATWLTIQGHDAVHTLDLPEGNRTTDWEICLFADREHRIVVTKDADFFETHLLKETPARLLIVATGNISNSDLVHLFQANIAEIDRLFMGSSVLEINLNYLISH